MSEYRSLSSIVGLGLALASVSSLAALPAPSGSDFDRLADQLDNSELALASAAETANILARLHALLPSDDEVRGLRYRYLNCYLAFPNDATAGFAYAEQGLQDALRSDDKAAEANFDFCRGQYRETLRTPSAALADYDAGIELARHLEDARLLGDGLVARGAVQSLLGEQAKALLDFLEAQRSYDGARKEAASELNLLNIATAYRRLGEFEKARGYLEQSRTFAAQRGDTSTLLAVDMQFGFLAFENNDAAHAHAPLQHALELARQMGDRGNAGAALLAQAQAYNIERKYRQAIEALRQSELEQTAISDNSNEGMNHLQYGIAHAGMGLQAEALKDFDAAERSLASGNNLRYLAQLHAARAVSYEALGKTDAALTDLKRLLETNEALEQKSRAEYTVLLSYQFDSARRDLENRRLAADKVMKEQELVALERIRQWQALAIVLGSLLLLLLAWFALRQFYKMRTLSTLAMTDPLTGVANRRRVEHATSQAIRQARAESRDMTILTFDIDHFKRINDNYGHEVGDQILVRVTSTCQAALRQFDQLGRTGGEEFLVVLPDTRLEAGMQVAERLCANVAGLKLDDLAVGLTVSISLGVTQLKPADSGMRALVRRADVALYRAKNNGRNRVEAEI
ncbi:GGDEF domain-containing protein [Dokdonella soli]|uniref:GGDEF domain-containing protein n=1 Tax=Dokdonella soli TaxID=529810 RepID=UPI0031D85BBA